MFKIELKYFVLNINFEYKYQYENSKLVLTRDKTRFLLLLPLNNNCPPGSSLSVVCLFFLNACWKTRKEGYILPYPVMVGYNCPSIL